MITQAQIDEWRNNATKAMNSATDEYAPEEFTQLLDEATQVRTGVNELWEAATVHCMTHCGEHMEGDPEFEMPDDPNEVMRIVAEYLEGAQ